IRRDVATRDDIVRELAALPKGAFDAIYHVPSGLVSAHIGLLIQRARADRVALMAHEDELVDAGALASYGANYRRMGQQTARVVDRVLGGVPPAEIPIQIPDKLTLAINLVTARTIGLKPPLAILERAERIVEQPFAPMSPMIGLRLRTLRRRLFLLLAATSVIGIVGVNLIWLPGVLRDVQAARSELQLVAVGGVRDQIDLFLADKEEALTTVAH